MTPAAAALIVKRFDGLEYDEALKLAEDFSETLKHMGPFDPAWLFMTRQRYDMYRLCEALDVYRDLDKTDHLVCFPCIISYDGGKKTEEVFYWINKIVPEKDYLKTARSMCIENLNKAHVSHQVYKDLEIVPV